MAAKSKNQTIFVVIGLLLVVIGFLLWIYFRNDNSHSWATLYRPDFDEPYDLSVLQEQLTLTLGEEKIVDVRDTIYQQIITDSVPENSNIVFIGNEIFLDSMETGFMLDFAKQGNTVFISADFFPERLMDSLFSVPEGYYYYYNTYTEQYEYDFNPVTTRADTTIVLEFERKELGLDTAHCTFIYDFEHHLYPWRFFRNDLYTRENLYVEELGSFNDSVVNFIRVPWGEGNFYLHTTPIVYTNYFSFNEKLNEYALNSFSVLGDGTIYWDEKDRYFEYDYPDLPQGTREKGPLVFLLSEPGLRFGWYLMIATSALYLAFGAKRKQRIIPVMDNMNNTSIEYAEVVSQLFMKQKDHKKLVLLKMDLFKSFLRERFMIRMPTDSVFDSEEFIKSISVKAHVPLNLVKDIFESYKYLSAIHFVETEQMLDFYNKVEEFYATCK